MRGADQRAADEESLALRFDPSARRREGRYFTPAALVDFSLQLASAHLPRDRPLAIVDPSCGAGAFLLSAHRLFPRARLFGLELSKAIAAECRRRVPAATVISADALQADLPRLLDQIPPGVFELWVGNPPYNGTSSLLQDARGYRAIRGLLPSSASTPPGTSLRDDFAFFLLLAAERLRNRDGALAFITSATLLDAYLYSQLRRAMLAALSLREAVDLGAGVFRGTRVRTCLTVWRSQSSSSHPPRFRGRPAAPKAAFHVSQLEAPAVFTPGAPDWKLRPSCPEAERLDQRWRRHGEPL
ncbi:MAG TPA: N-6 DNA methylase, partial [Myxococcaceae bacterium]|nr:N-6 DNA methylase [Myxococcaceae bacterium]